MSKPYYVLEADWINHPLAASVAGRPVTGTAKANYGAIEVTITSPITHFRRAYDHRGWAFGICAGYHPEERFAFRRKLTSKGQKAAEELLTDIFLDYLAITQHEAAVDKACRNARLEIAELGEVFAADRKPLEEERAALRRDFIAGRLSQQEHQRRRGELRERLDRHDERRRKAEGEVGERFSSWLLDLCGRRVSLTDAEALLRDVAVVVERGPFGE